MKKKKRPKNTLHGACVKPAEDLPLLGNATRTKSAKEWGVLAFDWRGGRNVWGWGRPCDDNQTLRDSVAAVKALTTVL